MWKLNSPFKLFRFAAIQICWLWDIYIIFTDILVQKIKLYTFDLLDGSESRLLIDLMTSEILTKSIRVNKRLAQNREINLINVQNFGRRLFTDHGLHLNRMGKKLLSKNIADSINNWFCNKSQLHNQNSNNEKWNRLFHLRGNTEWSQYICDNFTTSD